MLGEPGYATRFPINTQLFTVVCWRAVADAVPLNTHSLGAGERGRDAVPINTYLQWVWETMKRGEDMLHKCSRFDATCWVCLSLNSDSSIAEPTPAAPATRMIPATARPGCAAHDGNACAVDLTQPSLRGRQLTFEKWSAIQGRHRLIYVYPTVSNDLNTQHDMNAGPEELAVINRFRAIRLRVPGFRSALRQVTWTRWGAGNAGRPMTSIARRIPLCGDSWK